MERSHDAALDVLAAPPVAGGVPAQVALGAYILYEIDKGLEGRGGGSTPD